VCRRLGHEPKFWQAFCRGVGRDDLIAAQAERPGSQAHAQVQEIFRARTREQWEAFAREHDCCLEPMLELDEALSSDLVREREMVVELDQPGVPRPVRQLGLPVKLSRTPGDHAQLPGPLLGEHTERVLLAAGYSEAEVAELFEQGAVAGPAPQSQDISFQV
jgi:alpha-methylacyl-CoA racemase